VAEANHTRSGRARLTGRTAIVTGAGRGIGRAIARAMAREHAAVVVASRTLSEVEETAALIRAEGRRALAVAADVSDWQSVQDLATRTVDAFHGIDILVNNAGVQGCIGPLVENDVEAWARTVQINLLGVFHCCKAALPHMIQQRKGKIINLSGGGATGPRPCFSAYAASKAAVVRLTETLAEEVKPYYVQVNAIAPGAVNTNMQEQIRAAGARAGDRAWTEARALLKTGGTPPELAASLAVFLASDASNGLTGKLIAAPYNDGWQSWDADRIAELAACPWLTLRRMDPRTLGPLLDELRQETGHA